MGGRRPRFDWNASMNAMLGYSGESSSRGWRTSLVVAYEAAMKVPVCQLDEIQLGRFWGQGPEEAMLDVLIPTTIEHLRHDLFSAYGQPTLGYLVRIENFRTRPELEPALCALIEAWAPRLVQLLASPRILPLEAEVARTALEVAERYPAALYAFENAYRAIGDHEGVARILDRRAHRATNLADRIALSAQRAQLLEETYDLGGAQGAWFHILEMDPTPERSCDELLRLFALDPHPPWALLVIELRRAAKRLAPQDARELLRRTADIAATKLDDPDLAREILDELC